MKKQKLNSSKYDIAILGATGAVGESILSILEEREFPVGNLYLLASHRSKGNSMTFKRKAILVQDVEEFDFTKAQIGLFSAGSSVSAKYAPLAAAAGCVVIDNTSKFRMDEDIPLIIPEVNPHRIEDYKKRMIIANPNCSTIQLLVAIKPIFDKVGIERINVATYQAVSGTGRAAISELVEQTTELLNGRSISPKIFPKQIAFNVFPQCGDFQDDSGYSVEELKIMRETQKILESPELKVNATTARVPVFYGHSEAVHLETKEKILAKEVRVLLRQSPGIIVMDDPKKGEYPSPIPDCTGTDAVYVGRIRDDISHPKGLNMWVVADNIRKGAALNAVQIAEILVKDYL